MHNDTMRRLHHGVVTTFYRATPYKDYGTGPVVMWRVRTNTYDTRAEAEAIAEKYTADGADFVQLEVTTRARYIPEAERGSTK